LSVFFSDCVDNIKVVIDFGRAEIEGRSVLASDSFCSFDLGSSEGVMSKRLASRYSSGPSRNWIKTTCPGWKRINAERHKLFEAPRKPELTEAQQTLARKRPELARVNEHLRSPPLSHGIARELGKAGGHSGAGNR
jgi:hypothetical protein